MGLSRRIMQLQRRLSVWCALTPSNLSMVLVFALAYITVRAYVMKMMRQQRALYELQPPELQYRDVGRIFSQVKLKTTLRDCPISSLDKRLRAKSGLPSGELHESFLYGSCRRVPPVPGSCDVANEIFFSQPTASCSSQSSFNFCQIVGNPDVGWRVACNETVSAVCQPKYSVGVMNQTSGELDWTQQESLSQVVDLLNKLLHKNVNFNHFGFVFIKCVVKKASVDSENYSFDDEYESSLNFEMPSVDTAEQLLILPPQFVKTTISEKKEFRNIISINLVLIDSVSHQHFYRSLNASVNALEKIEASPHPVASVFDFELVQAIKSRTYENLQAIFGGIVDTKSEPFETQDIPPEPLKLEAMLAGFKQQGYKTLWLEDLCHAWEWGLSKDLHFLTDGDTQGKEFWDNMWQKLHQAELDDVGPTLAMCRVLQANGVRDHFHGPDAVCFNGRHQHEYLLDYLLMYQQTAYTAQQPTFTFLQTNVAHEDSGKRIQTLDQALASYIESVSHLSNTLTIIFSDHGNSYGVFHKKSQEAKRELYHPAMFFIVPNRVGRILGKDVMHALKVNTKRLTSFLDLHKALLYMQHWKRKSLVDLNSSTVGLFSPVDSSRTCNDIPRIKPNLCICENFETPVANDTDYNLLAYFAIGRLNDEIQKQALKSWFQSAEESSKPTSLGMIAFPTCEKLFLRGVENIKRSSEENGSLNIKMELMVQMSQVFLVSLVMRPQTKTTSDNHGPLLKLQTYERLTSYGQFSSCAEADNVWPSLCVCSQMGPNLAVLNDNKHLKKENSYTSGKLESTFNTSIQSFNFTFETDVNVDQAYNSGNGDIKSAENDLNKYVVFNGKSFPIPQYNEYINQKVFPAFRVSAQYLKKNEKNIIISKIIGKEQFEKCLLLVWTRHPKGVVLSAANTCQYFFSVLISKSFEKDRQASGPSSILFTASPPDNAKEAVVMPRGTKTLAFIWDQNTGNFSSTVSVHLQLQVMFLS